MRRFTGLATGVLFALGTAGCGAEGGVDNVTQNVTVMVEPPSAQLILGGALRFSAAVTGAVNRAVQWRVQEGTGGTIDVSGTYTAPADPGSFHIIATSVADPTVSGIASVTVTATPAIGVYVSPKAPTVTAGQTQVFSATVTGTTGSQSGAVTWRVGRALRG